jgi:hypothetical protein
MNINPTENRWDMTIRLSGVNKRDIENLEAMMDKHYLSGILSHFNSKKERRKNHHIKELEYGNWMNYRKGGMEIVSLGGGYYLPLGEIQDLPLGAIHNVELNIQEHNIGFLSDILDLNPKIDLEFKRNFKESFTRYEHFKGNEYHQLYEKIILGN